MIAVLEQSITVDDYRDGDELVTETQHRYYNSPCDAVDAAVKFVIEHCHKPCTVELTLFEATNHGPAKHLRPVAAATNRTSNGCNIMAALQSRQIPREQALAYPHLLRDAITVRRVDQRESASDGNVYALVKRTVIMGVFEDIGRAHEAKLTHVLNECIEYADLTIQEVPCDWAASGGVRPAVVLMLIDKGRFDFAAGSVEQLHRRAKEASLYGKLMVAAFCMNRLQRSHVLEPLTM